MGRMHSMIVGGCIAKVLVPANPRHHDSVPVLWLHHLLRVSFSQELLFVHAFELARPEREICPDV
jgi:hypothetical protein